MLPSPDLQLGKGTTDAANGEATKKPRDGSPSKPKLPIPPLQSLPSVTINHHKRNRQSENEMEVIQPKVLSPHTKECGSVSLDVKTDPLDSDFCGNGKGNYNGGNISAVSQKGDCQFDRCSLAKKPRDDTNLGDENDDVLENKSVASMKLWETESTTVLAFTLDPENDSNTSSTVGSIAAGCNGSKNIGEDYSDDDDDYDDLEDGGPPSDMEDYLDEDVCDDAMMEDDSKSIASTSTEFSTGSSVGSNTPSLLGENLESFCLGETEKGAPEGAGVSKNKNWVQTSPLVRSSIKPLRRSLFSHVPPTITFVHHNEVSETPLPAEVRKHLRWKLSNITPAVVKRIVTNSGFRLMRRTCTEWGGIWGKHMKSPQFKDVHEGQKLNHLPGTFNIGRKDRLWKNYQRLRLKYGKEEFSFLPRTFLLPSETKLLRRVWERRGCRAKWIVKPPALARGTGIKVVNKWSQIPKMRPLIVQKYVARPHLINNTKYDLRIYVLLTSLCPLRVFLYDEGLVRFASNVYSADNASLSDVYTHLTNYSINKFSSTYQANEDSDCRQGHKWTLASLWQYFAESGIDSAPVIESIKDLVIKTIVSAENSMYTVYRQNLASHYSGYELFGFDVLLDSKLKPWLIEVNISPSLHSSSPLDLDVKSPLATEVFNLARYHIPPAKMSARTQREVLSKLNMGEGVTQLCMDRRLYQRELSKSERAKQDRFVAAASAACATSAQSSDSNASETKNREPGGRNSSCEIETKTRDSLLSGGDMDRSTYIDSILEHLTPDDVRVLIRSEDELAQTTHFSRIFPTQDTHKYFKYFETTRYYNLLFDAWEAKYGADHRAAAIDRLERLCVEKIHLKIPVPAGSTATASSLQKNGNFKTTRSKPGPGNHPQPPLFSTLDVSTLKAPTGSSCIGQGFCGHYPPHSAGSLLDCVSTTERALMSKSNLSAPNVQTNSAMSIINTNTFICSAAAPSKVNECANTSNTTPKVKVSQICVTAKPNCVKTATPPLTNPSRRSATAVTKSLCSSRKSVPSPEPMSTGGDETTSSEKGSRSPSPPRSQSGTQSADPFLPTKVNNTKNDNQRTQPFLDNSRQIANCTRTSSKNIGNAQVEEVHIGNTMHIETSGIVPPTPTTTGENNILTENDNVNGNVNTDHAVISRQ